MDRPQFDIVTGGISGPLTRAHDDRGKIFRVPDAAELARYVFNLNLRRPFSHRPVILEATGDAISLEEWPAKGFGYYHSRFHMALAEIARSTLPDLGRAGYGEEHRSYIRGVIQSATDALRF